MAKKFWPSLPTLFRRQPRAKAPRSVYRRPLLEILEERVLPDANPTIVNVATLTERSTDVVPILIGGTTPGANGYDQINVQNQATLAGTLQLKLINGFVPRAGQIFDVLTYGSVTGHFDQVQGLDAGNGLRFVPIQTNAQGSLRLVVSQTPAGGVEMGAATKAQADALVAFFGGPTPTQPVNFDGDLTVLNKTLTGTFQLQDVKAQSGTEVVAVTTSNAGIRFSLGVQDGLLGTSGTGTFLLNSTGAAGQISVAIAAKIPGIDQLTGNFSLVINSTTVAVNETVTLTAGQSPIAVTAKAGPLVRVEGTGTLSYQQKDKDGNAVANTPRLNAQGSFAIDSTQVTSGTQTTTAFLFGITGADPNDKNSQATLKVIAQGNADKKIPDVGVQVSGSAGLYVAITSDSAAGTLKGGVAMVAQGDAALVGLDKNGLTLKETGSLSVNFTGTDMTVPDPNNPGKTIARTIQAGTQTITFSFPDANNRIHLDGTGTAGFQALDKDGNAVPNGLNFSAQGAFGLDLSIATTGTQTTTQFQFGVTGTSKDSPDATLKVIAQGNTDKKIPDVGVQVTGSAGLFVAVTTDSAAGTVKPGVALVANGAASLLGLDKNGLTLKENGSLSVNFTGTDMTVPDPNNAGKTIARTIQAGTQTITFSFPDANNRVHLDGTGAAGFQALDKDGNAVPNGLNFSAQGAFGLDLSIATTGTQTTTQFQFGVTGTSKDSPDATLKVIAQGNTDKKIPDVGVQVTGSAGLFVAVTTDSAAGTVKPGVALVANGAASLLGLDKNGLTLKENGSLSVNFTGTDMTVPDPNNAGKTIARTIQAGTQTITFSFPDANNRVHLDGTGTASFQALDKDGNAVPNGLNFSTQGAFGLDLNIATSGTQTTTQFQFGITGTTKDSQATIKAVVQGNTDKKIPDVGVKVTGSGGLFVAVTTDSATGTVKPGVALVAQGDAALVGLDKNGLTLKETGSLSVNFTDTDMTVPDPNNPGKTIARTIQAGTQTITFSFPDANNRVHLDGTGTAGFQALDKDGNAVPNGLNFSAQGAFGLDLSIATTGTQTTTQFQFGVTGTSKDSPDATLKVIAQGNTDKKIPDVGVQVTGSAGLFVAVTTDSAAGTIKPGVALVANGAASLLGLDKNGLTLKETGSLSVNFTGTDMTVPDPNNAGKTIARTIQAGTQTITFSFPDANNRVHLDGTGTAGFQALDKDGNAVPNGLNFSAQGAFGLDLSIATTGTQTTTQFQFGVTGTSKDSPDATLKVIAQGNTDKKIPDVGVQVTGSAGLFVAVTTDSATGTIKPGVALVANGAASLLGLDKNGLTLKETGSLSVNFTGTDMTVPDPNNAGKTIARTIQAGTQTITFSFPDANNRVHLDGTGTAGFQALDKDGNPVANGLNFTADGGVGLDLNIATSGTLTTTQFQFGITGATKDSQATIKAVVQGNTDKKIPDVGVQVTGSAALYVAITTDSAAGTVKGGAALVAQGDAALVGLDKKGLTLKETGSLSVNFTGTDMTVPDPNDATKQVPRSITVGSNKIEFKFADASYTVHLDGTGSAGFQSLDSDGKAVPNGLTLSAQGGFGLDLSVATSGTQTTTLFQFGVTGATKDTQATIKVVAQGNPDKKIPDVGFQVSGSAGLFITITTDSAAGTLTGGAALVAQGEAALVGLEEKGLTVKSNGSLRFNLTGTDVTVPDPNNPGKTIPRSITVGSNKIDLDFHETGKDPVVELSGGLQLVIKDLYTLTGNFSFGLSQNVTGTVTTTTIKTGATNVGTFIALNGDKTGVSLSNATLGLIVTTTYDSTAATQTAPGYALVASGTIGVTGGPDLTLQGTLGLKLNRSGTDMTVNGQPRTVSVGKDTVTLDFTKTGTSDVTLLTATDLTVGVKVGDLATFQANKAALNFDPTSNSKDFLTFQNPTIAQDPTATFDPAKVPDGAIGLQFGDGAGPLKGWGGVAGNFAIGKDLRIRPKDGFFVQLQIGSSPNFGLPTFLPVQLKLAKYQLNPGAVNDTGQVDLTNATITISGGISQDANWPIFGTFDGLSLNVGQVIANKSLTGAINLKGFSIGVQDVNLFGLKLTGKVSLGTVNVGTDSAWYLDLAGKFSYSNLGGGIEIAFSQYGPLVASLSVGAIVIPAVGLVFSLDNAGLMFGLPALGSVDKPEDLLTKQYLEPSKVSQDTITTGLKTILAKPADQRGYTWNQSFRLAATGTVTNIYLQGLVTGSVTLAADMGFGDKDPGLKFLAAGDVKVFGFPLGAGAILVDLSNPVAPRLDAAFRAGSGVSGNPFSFLIPTQVQFTAHLDTTGIIYLPLVGVRTFFQQLVGGQVSTDVQQLVNPILNTLANSLEKARQALVANNATPSDLLKLFLDTNGDGVLSEDEKKQTITSDFLKVRVYGAQDGSIPALLLGTNLAEMTVDTIKRGSDFLQAFLPAFFNTVNDLVVQGAMALTQVPTLITDLIQAIGPAGAQALATVGQNFDKFNPSLTISASIQPTLFGLKLGSATQAANILIDKTKIHFDYTGSALSSMSAGLTGFPLPAALLPLSDSTTFDATLKLPTNTLVNALFGKGGGATTANPVQDLLDSVNPFKNWEVLLSTKLTGFGFPLGTLSGLLFPPQPKDANGAFQPTGLFQSKVVNLGIGTDGQPTATATPDQIPVNTTAEYQNMERFGGFVMTGRLFLPNFLIDPAAVINGLAWGPPSVNFSNPTTLPGDLAKVKDWVSTIYNGLTGSTEWGKLQFYIPSPAQLVNTNSADQNQQLARDIVNSAFIEGYSNLRLLGVDLGTTQIRGTAQGVEAMANIPWLAGLQVTIAAQNKTVQTADLLTQLGKSPLVTKILTTLNVSSDFSFLQNPDVQKTLRDNGLVSFTFPVAKFEGSLDSNRLNTFLAKTLGLPRNVFDSVPAAAQASVQVYTPGYGVGDPNATDLQRFGGVALDAHLKLPGLVDDAQFNFQMQPFSITQNTDATTFLIPNFSARASVKNLTIPGLGSIPGLLTAHDFTFDLSKDPAKGLALTMGGSLDVFGQTLSGAGQLQINDEGVFGSLRLGAKNTVVQGPGFSLQGDFILEVNTTSQTQSDIPLKSVRLQVNGSLTVGGFVVQGTFLLSAANGALTMSVKGSTYVTALATALQVAGNLTVVSGPNQGLYGDLQVAVSTVARGLYSLTGNFQMEINNTGLDREVPGFTVNRTTGAITSGLVTLPRNTVAIDAGGTLTVLGSRVLAGRFDMSAANGYLALSLDATANLAGLASFTVNGQGRFNFDGTLALNVSASGLNNGFRLTASTASFQVNTSDAEQLNVPGKTVQAEVGGTLWIGAFALSGNFRLVVTNGALGIGVTATTYVTALGQPLRVAGSLDVSSAGVVGNLRINLPTVEVAGLFSMSGQFQFEANTTNQDSRPLDGFTVNTANGQATSQKITIPQQTVRIDVGGKLTAFGLTVAGQLDLAASATGLSLATNGTVSLFGVILVVQGNATIYTDHNLTINLAATLNGGNPVGIGAGVFSISAGSARLLVNTAGDTRDNMAPNTHELRLSDVKADFLGFQASAPSVSIGALDGGIFQVAVPSSNPLRLDFFGYQTLTLSGYFRSDGLFNVTAGARMDLTFWGTGVVLDGQLTFGDKGLSGKVTATGKFAGRAIVSLTAGVSLQNGKVVAVAYNGDGSVKDTYIIAKSAPDAPPVIRGFSVPATATMGPPVESSVAAVVNGDPNNRDKLTVSWSAYSFASGRVEAEYRISVNSGDASFFYWNTKYAGTWTIEMTVVSSNGTKLVKTATVTVVPAPSAKPPVIVDFYFPRRASLYAPVQFLVFANNAPGNVGELKASLIITGPFSRNVFLPQVVNAGGQATFVGTFLFRGTYQVNVTVTNTATNLSTTIQDTFTIG